jgi:phospho-N-acetylmuramoyl-pentapeptide-transferase
MNLQNAMPLVLGVFLFSFLINSILIIPFIDILYKFRLIRGKEAPKKGKVPLFDKLHDKKAGTPVGGGILLILTSSVLFAVLLVITKHMGIPIKSSYAVKNEIFLIFFTYFSFAMLGISDDIMKIFGKPKKGRMGLLFGLTRRDKFLVQVALAGFIGFYLNCVMGIEILHIPIFDLTLRLGYWYIPFASFVVVSFCNAFNITDGLDGLSSGLLFICVLAFGIIAANNLDAPLTLFLALWSGALLAFLYFNVWPARIWLGDTGALSFGATLGVIGLITGNIVALIFIGGIFVVEVASSAIQILGWKYLKRPILPLAPLHNTFLALGWEEPKIVMRAWLAGIILAIFGLWLATI